MTSADWFFTQLPPSRFVVEAGLRSSFWRAGYGNLWWTCLSEIAPYSCLGVWHNKEFNMKWEPGQYLQLTMSEPDQDLLGALERILKHKALAAYKNGDNEVVVEWRVQDPDSRYAELQASGVPELERLN